MSNELGEFYPTEPLDAEPMAITATLQENGGIVQFTIGGEFCVLDESQVTELIKRLRHRIYCEPGYTATGDFSGELDVHPSDEEML